jgi:hypothetical protein
MLCLITYRRLAQGVHLLLAISFFITLRCCLHFINFFNVQNRKYTKALLHCTVHKIFFSNKSLFAQIGLRTREFRPFYFGDGICPEISERATLDVFSITLCTALQIRWFLMCWNGNLMELLDILFSLFVHLWTSSQIDEDSSIHCGTWRGWWFI